MLTPQNYLYNTNTLQYFISACSKVFLEKIEDNKLMQIGA